MNKLIERLFRVSMVASIVSIFLIEARKGFFKHIRDYVRIVCWTPYYYMILVFVILFIAVFSFDLTLMSNIQNICQAPFLNGLANVGKWIGRNDNFWTVMVSLYFLTLIFFPKKTGFVFGAVLSAALSGIICTAAKHAFLRARPENNFGPYSFFNLNGFVADESHFLSFPSGDVILVAGAAGYCFFAFRKYSVSWLILLLPLMTALSRMELNRHWPSDTLASIFIGIMMGKFIWDYFQKYSREN